MKQDIRLDTFDGIEVGLNRSVVLILALFAWELGLYVLPAHPAWESSCVSTEPKSTGRQLRPGT